MTRPATCGICAPTSFAKFAMSLASIAYATFAPAYRCPICVRSNVQRQLPHDAHLDCKERQDTRAAPLSPQRSKSINCWRLTHASVVAHHIKHHLVFETVGAVLHDGPLVRLRPRFVLPPRRHQRAWGLHQEVVVGGGRCVALGARRHRNNDSGGRRTCSISR